VVAGDVVLCDEVAVAAVVVDDVMGVEYDGVNATGGNSRNGP